MQALDDHAEIDEANGAIVKTLWADPAIQKVWERRAEFQVVETNKKFFDELEGNPAKALWTLARSAFASALGIDGSKSWSKVSGWQK